MVRSAAIVVVLRVLEAHAPLTVRSLKHLPSPNLHYVQHCVAKRTHL